MGLCLYFFALGIIVTVHEIFEPVSFDTWYSIKMKTWLLQAASLQMSSNLLVTIKKYSFDIFLTHMLILMCQLSTWQIDLTLFKI